MAIDDKPENDRVIPAFLLRRIRARPCPLARLVDDRRCIEPAAKIGIDAAELKVDAVLNDMVGVGFGAAVI